MGFANTPLGVNWINQFDDEDRDTARLLLDSLIYISNQHLIDSFKKQLDGFLLNKAKGPIALFAARENTGEKYWPNKKKRPMSVSGRKAVGSEGMLSNLCRDISLTNDNVLNHPSLNEISRKRCRHIICIDDNIGSGHRMVNFIKWIYANKTIKSWHSLHYIDFIACACVVSWVGRKELVKYGIFSDILAEFAIGRGRPEWTESEFFRIEALCQNYAYYTNHPHRGIGYADTFACFAFSHKCPNTNPAILWSTHKGVWHALFSDRPEFVLNGKSYNPTIITNKIIRELTLRSDRFQRLSEESQQMVLLLFYINKHRKDDFLLSQRLGLSIPIILQLIGKIQEYGWIDQDRIITKSGRKILQEAKINKRIPMMNIQVKDEFYFPQRYRSPSSQSSSGPSSEERHE